MRIKYITHKIVNKILSWKSNARRRQLVKRASSCTSKGEMLYPQRRILNKYRSTWFRSRSSLWENGQDDESQENFAILDATRPWTPIQACLSLSTVTLDGYFSAFASRVANAPRKLRYHQLCSPASLPTEWTQSGSLSSESSFRWSLSYVHSLTDRVMAYDRHTTIPKHLLVANLRSSRKRGTLYCFCQTRHVISLSIELDIRSHYTLVTRDFEINSNDRRNENCKAPYYLNEKNSTHFSTLTNNIHEIFSSLQIRPLVLFEYSYCYRRRKKRIINSYIF